MMMPRNETIARLALVAFSLVFAVGLIETTVLLKLVDYRLALGTMIDVPWLNPVNRIDPEVLHLRQPNLHLKGVMNGGDISIHMNVPSRTDYPYDAMYDRNGFRNDPNLEQADIALLGDSFIEAYTVSQELTVASLLGKLQGRAVANLGQLWYGPQQELAALKRYAVPLKPKLVVWAFFGGNDLSDYRRYAEAKYLSPKIR